MTNKTRPTIDLNTVDENVLVQKLKISPRLAKRILAQRPYQSVSELNKVWGIDPSTLQRILPLVNVTPSPLSDTASEALTAQPVAGETATGVEQLQEPVASALPGSEQTQFGEPQAQPETLESPTPAAAARYSWLFNVALVLILLVGAYFRFIGLNWDENHHQHPDERFITMVAEALRGVKNAGEYFDTAHSTLNPLKYGSYTYGMLPLFITRTIAEWVKMANFDPIALVGRAMSGLFDLAAVWMLYILGKRLYDKRTGILAAALYAAAVLPIQLSHYFAVDSFSTVFVIACLYYASLAIPTRTSAEKFTAFRLLYFGLFGVAAGLAGACKVNTLPVIGVIVLAGIVRLVMSWRKPGFRIDLYLVLSGWVLAVVMAFVAFRIFQPYAFTGPGFFDIKLNPKWLEVIKEVTNQVAGKSEWPPNHHWTNRPISYAWINMVIWGLGLPLGLAGWAGWIWAAVRIWKGDWRSHYLPFVWVAGYFFWQNSQFWRYMRYFMPVYPFLVLFAAWALLELFDRTRESRKALQSNGFRFSSQMADFRKIWKGALALLAVGIVVLATYGYAFAFTRIYSKPITRITASRWMLANIPGPLNLIVETPQGSQSYPVFINNRFVVLPGETSAINLKMLQSGTASTISATEVGQIGVNIYFRLTRDEAGEDIVTQGRLSLTDDAPNDKQFISFGDVDLEQGRTYYFYYKVHNSSRVSLSGVRLAKDNPENPTLPVDWAVQDQAPGLLEGTIPIEPSSPITLNRLDFDQIQQVFVPTETTFKVGLYTESDDQNPIATASETLNFSQPGIKLSPVFKFTPLQLAGGKIYRVHYEITGGGPLALEGVPYTLETSWDDALPLSVDNYDALGGIYSPMNLELYDADTPEKRAAMIRVLEKSQYIVMPSNRAYDAMPRLPLRYPMTLKYFQTLFDCNCSGDALENRAYSLEPPFKSPLGFDLIATFESPPTLGPISLPDQSADESFTVYDHPKVLIFKKSADFSIAAVTALLNSVDLEQVVFQSPLSYTQAPTAMQLPADRLAVQTAGGTWSAMFNRTASINVNQLLGAYAWYLALLLLGWIAFPLVFVGFRGLTDRGYPLARMAGLIIIGWLAWSLGSYKILPFTRLTIALCTGILLVLSAWFAYRRREELVEFIHSNWKHILATELIFLVLFLFYIYVRLGNPDLWHPWRGGEKPMDFAFFNAVLKTVYFPPQNPWFSGHYINYYYYGYVLASIPTKLLGILPNIVYNLVLPSWFAMIGIGVFCIGFNLVAGFRNGLRRERSADEEKYPSRPVLAQIFGKNSPYLVGVIAILVILFAGNLYMVREFWKYFPELSLSGGEVSSPLDRAGAVIGGTVRLLTGQAELPGENDRWYFEASRPILHDGPDTPIAEFPYFTFLYGDLHAHLLTMPNYALALGWMLSLLFYPFSKMKWGERIGSLILGGLVFGSFLPSHTWDFPTFIGLGSLVLIWDAWQNRRGPIQHTIQTIVGYVLAFAGLAIAFYWPFEHWFDTEYASLELWTGVRTPLIDYLFVFGLALFVIVSLLIRDLFSDFTALFERWVPKTTRRRRFSWRRLEPYIIFLIAGIVISILWINDYQVLAFGLPLVAGMLYLIFLKSDLSLLQRIIWTLFAVGLSLTMAVEVVVLKGDVGRSNMVFRFYDQAWFIFGLAISVALVDLLASISHWRRWLRIAWPCVLGLILLSAASYPLIATGKKISDRWPDIQNPPHTLDGMQFLLGEADDPSGKGPVVYNDEDRLINLTPDYAGIHFMQDNISGSPVIVEGSSQEYRWGARYAIYTGLPSVIGWSWHIRQQNTLLDGAFIDKRISEVNDFYNTPDTQAATKFLKRYHVQYIVVGSLERLYYSAEGIAKFQQMVDQGLLQVAYGDNTADTATIYKVLSTND